MRDAGGAAWLRGACSWLPRPRALGHARRPRGLVDVLAVGRGGVADRLRAGIALVARLTGLGVEAGVGVEVQVRRRGGALLLLAGTRDLVEREPAAARVAVAEGRRLVARPQAERVAVELRLGGVEQHAAEPLEERRG